MRNWRYWLYYSRYPEPHSTDTDTRDGIHRQGRQRPDRSDVRIDTRRYEFKHQRDPAARAHSLFWQSVPEPERQDDQNRAGDFPAPCGHQGCEYEWGLQ